MTVNRSDIMGAVRVGQVTGGRPPGPEQGARPGEVGCNRIRPHPEETAPYLLARTAEFRVREGIQFTLLRSRAKLADGAP
jgi:hypothetical protein